MKEQNIAPPQVSLPVFTLNAKWQITFFSQSAENLLGVKAAAAIGMNCQDFFNHPDHLADFLNSAPIWLQASR